MRRIRGSGSGGFEDSIAVIVEEFKALGTLLISAGEESLDERTREVLGLRIAEQGERLRALEEFSSVARNCVVIKISI